MTGCSRMGSTGRRRSDVRGIDMSSAKGARAMIGVFVTFRFSDHFDEQALQALRIMGLAFQQGN